MVGVAGFEPAAHWSQTSCATKLRYTPMFGRGRRTRTLGTRFWRPLLYQLSYTPTLERTIDSQYGGEDGIRTHAALANPNDLANRPLQPLEYFSRLELIVYYLMAERVGFEPTEVLPSLVFKTSTINRSDTSPHATVVQTTQPKFLVTHRRFELRTP